MIALHDEDSKAINEMFEEEEPRVVDRLVGCLVVTRVAEIRTMADWTELCRRSLAAIDASPGEVVVCADCRSLRVMSHSLAATGHTFTGYNGKIDFLDTDNCASMPDKQD